MRLVPLTTLNGVTPITQVTTTGTLTSGSAIVTGIPNTAAIIGAVSASGVGVPGSTYVYAINSSTQVTLSQDATANGSQAVTFNLEPVDLPDAKLHCRIEYPDDDSLVASLITSARRYAETYLRSALLTQTWVLYLDSFPSAGGYYNRAIREVWPTMGGLPSGLGFYPGLVPNSTGVIDVPLPPLQSITSVQYYDFLGVLQTVDPSTYNVSLGSPARIQPAYSMVWPISRPTIDSVQITFVAGYGNTADKVEENIKAAIKLMVGHWYENREWVSEGGLLIAPNTVDALLSASDPGIYA